jgi:hypothetical protein
VDDKNPAGPDGLFVLFLYLETGSKIEAILPERSS